MARRNLFIAVAAGMALSASALGAGPSTGSGMKMDRQATQPMPSQQESQLDRTTGARSMVTGADFDRESASISRSLQRSEPTVAADGTASSQNGGVAGSPGQLMGRNGQLTDSGSAGFDSYVDQVNHQMNLSEPAPR